MITVVAYTFETGAREQAIDMPSVAQLLTIQMHYAKPTLWALVDTNSPTRRRRFFLVGNGEGIDQLFAQRSAENGGRLDGNTLTFYVGTFQMTQGAVVRHIFAEQ